MTDLPPLSAGESLGPGDENDHVWALQQALADRGYLTQSPDGAYGDFTEAAVRDFQRDHGLLDDGLVGEQTWNTLAAQIPHQQDAPYGDHQPSGHEPGEHESPEHESGEQTPTGLQPGDVSEDGHWRWDGHDWVAAHQTPAGDTTQADGGAGMVSEDGQWVWDGQQWQPHGGEQPDDELTPEIFQQVIAESMQVNASGQA